MLMNGIDEDRIDASLKIDHVSKRNLDNLFKAFSIVGDSSYIYVADMKYDISRFSRSACEMFNLDHEYMYHAQDVWGQVVHPEDKKEYNENVDSLFAGKALGHDMQYRARTRDGNYVTVSCRGAVICDENEKPRYFGGAIRVLGERQMQYVLTGLRNQYGFFFDLKNQLHLGHDLCIMMIGVRGFSRINNTFGYYFGNRVIQDLCQRIRVLAGDGIDLYHLDGSRFMLISNRHGIDEMQLFYERLRSQLSSFVEVDGRHVILSVGGSLLAVSPTSADVRTIYSCLTYSFEESKRLKQGDLVVFDHENDKGKQELLEKISAVRASIVHNFAGFELYYQPIISAKTGTLSAAEALIRWSSPKYGLVPPNDFIPVLEQDNLFPKLGDWILRQALKDCAEYAKRDSNFLINVNASYSQFERDDYVQSVKDALTQTGVNPRNLCIELTERCRLLDMSLLDHKISELKAIGVKFALDDFGTGYSSVNALRNLQVDIVKIDRAFVKDIETNNKDRDFIGVIAKLASVIGASLCVEGIETKKMVDLLAAYGVKSLQGYLFSKPVPIEKFHEVARNFLKS